MAVAETGSARPAAAGNGPAGPQLPSDRDLAARFRSLDNLVYLLPLRIETLKERGYTFQSEHEADLQRLFESWSGQRETLLHELESRAGDPAAVQRVAAQIGRFESQFRSHEDIVSRAEELYDQLEDASFKLEADELPRWFELADVSWQRRRAPARIFATNRRYVVEEVEGPAAGKGFNRVLTAQQLTDLLEFTFKTPLLAKQPNLIWRFPDGKLVIHNADPELWSQRLAGPVEPQKESGVPAASAMPPPAFVSQADSASQAQPRDTSGRGGELPSGEADGDWLDRVLSTNAAVKATPGDFETVAESIAAAVPENVPTSADLSLDADLPSGQDTSTVFLSAELAPELDAFEPAVTAKPVAAPEPAAAPRAVRARPKPRPRSQPSDRPKAAPLRPTKRLPLRVAAALLGLIVLGGGAAWWWINGGLVPRSTDAAALAPGAERAPGPAQPTAESSPADRPENAPPGAAGAIDETPAAGAVKPSEQPVATAPAQPAAVEPELAAPPPPVERRIVDPLTNNRTLADRSATADRLSSSERYYIIHLRNGESMTVNWYRRSNGGIRIPLHRLGEVEINDSEIERIETRRY